MLRLTTLLLAATLAAAQQPPAINQDDNARKAREILEQSLKALGGDAFLTYRDMHSEGRLHSVNRHGQPSIGIPFFRTWVWPDKERLEFFKDKEWVVIHSGEQGWETTFRGTRAETEEELAEFRRRRDFSLENIYRVWLQQPNTALFYDGLSLAEAKEVHKVTLMTASNQAVTLFIDSKSFLPVQKSFTWRDPKTRDRNEDSELYGNYHLVQGIQTPHIITRSRNGSMTSQRFVKSVRYNQGFPASLFAATVTIEPGQYTRKLQEQERPKE